RKSRNRRFAVAMLIIGMVFGVVFPWGAAGGGAEAAAGVALRSDGADAPGEWVIGLSEAVQGETERERLAVDLVAHGIVLLDADERMWLVRGGGQQIHRLQSAYPDLMIQPNLTYELRVDDVEPFRMTTIGADR